MHVNQAIEFGKFIRYISSKISNSCVIELSSLYYKELF